MNDNSYLANKCDVNVWHKRLGHPCERIMRHVFKSLNWNGNFNDFSFCKDFHFGKHHQGHFSSSQLRASKPLELVHTDLWGPTPILSREWFRYYVHFINDHSKYT